jgi:hypothetical protein
MMSPSEWLLLGVLISTVLINIQIASMVTFILVPAVRSMRQKK